MKIIFSNPPWWTNEAGTLRYGIRAGSRWPFTAHAHCAPDQFSFGGYIPFPFFMGYAASYVQRAFPDATVTLRDSIALRESYQRYFDFLASHQPDVVIVESATPSWEHDAAICRRIAALLPGVRIFVTGTITSTRAAEALALPGVVAAIQGEYEKGTVAALRGQTGTIGHDLLTKEEMNAAPFPLLSADTALHYWDACPAGQMAPQLQVWASRGCPYKCMAGDTLVNTVEGMKPIRDLVGREGLGVFTYDPVEKRARVCTATNIRKYGDRDKLVRVHFDDGSHIDCTPDHRFLAFKWGNQHTGEKEWACEAKDLRPGTHVRALNTFLNGNPGNQYLTAAWKRKGSERVHRMVAEWKIGRRLLAGEVVHHEDRNKLNNNPDNLSVCADTKAHFAEHPEIAQRMRENNPARNMTPEWRAKMSAGLRGLTRSPESRERYRLAAIKREALKSPEQKTADAERMQRGLSEKKPWLHRLRANDGRFEPADLQNHCVVSVEALPGEHEVFCLTIPETGWFYANNVLVKNCCFCAWPATMTGNDPDGTRARIVRCYSPEYMEAFLGEAIVRHGYRSVYFDDDTFNLVQRHTLEMCEVMKRVSETVKYSRHELLPATGRIPWSAMCRADTIDRDTWEAMHAAGCFGVKIGFESGSQRVINEIVNKRLDLAEAADTAMFLQKEVGMKVHGTFTVGLPGETPEEARQTIDFIARGYRAGAFTTHQLSGTAVIEGTPLGTLHDMGAGGHLATYVGANMDETFIASADGQLKIEEMSSRRTLLK